MGKPRTGRLTASIFTAAALFAFSGILSLSSAAYAQSTQASQTPESAKQSAAPNALALKGDPANTKPAPPAKPLWKELTLEQRQALSPLSAEWDKLDATQKTKWLVISKKYSTLQPDQQVRLQERMRDWVKLTPEQRRAARENYSKAKKLDPSRKSAEWEQYQQLPEEQKKKLAETAAKNRVANLPPPSAAKNNPVPPKNKPLPGRSPAPGASAPQVIPENSNAGSQPVK